MTAAEHAEIARMVARSDPRQRARRAVEAIMADPRLIAQTEAVMRAHVEDAIRAAMAAALGMAIEIVKGER